MTRRWLLSLLGPAGLLLCAQPAPDVKKLSADELKQILEEKKDQIFLLDVREPKELEDLGTVEGYVNIPMGQIEDRLGKIPKDRDIVIA